MYTNEQYSMLSGQSRLLAYKKALTTLTDNLEKYPYDGRTATYLAHVLDLTPPEAQVDEALLNRAIDSATEISPRRLQPHYIRANISLKKGDAAKSPAERAKHYAVAIEILKAYAESQPRSADPRFIIANLYLSMGEEGNAQKWAAEGESLYAGNSESAQRAVKYYIQTENWPMAKRFLESVVKGRPIDYPIHYDLAKVTFLSGDKEGAQKIVDRLRTQSPGLVESDLAFLQALEGK